MSVGAPRVMPPAGRLFELLLSIGWELPLAPMWVPVDLPGPSLADVAIGTWGMRLTTRTEVNDGILTAEDGGPPGIPPGWWGAVDTADGRCAVILVDVVDLARRRTLIRQLNNAATRGAVLTGRAQVTRSET